MRKLFGKWIVIVAALSTLLLLAGCDASTSMLALEVAEDGSSATVTAENAEENASAFSDTLVVNKGDFVQIAADFNEEGELNVILVSTDILDEDTGEEELKGIIAMQDYALNETIRGTATEDYTVPVGKYCVYVEAGETLTGTANIQVMASDTEQAKVGDEDGQNPVMNFIGPYVCDRATMLIEADGDTGAKVSVTWGGSASETAEWTMSGPFDTEDLVIEYHDCVKKDVTYNEDGDVESEEEVYTGGYGFINFGENGTLTWQDDIEHVADNMTFNFDADAQ